MHLLQQLEAWQMWEQAAVIFKQIIASSNACDKDITLDTDDTADDDHCSSNSPDPTPAPKPKVIRVVKTLGQVALKTPKHKQISVTSETLVSKKGTVCKKAVTDQSGKPLRSLLHQSAAETISESPIRKSDRKVTPSKFHSAIVELLQHKEVEVHHTKSVAGGGFVTEAKKMGQKQPQQSPAVLARKTTPRKQHVVAVRKVKCNKSSPIQFSDNMGCQSVNRDTLIDGSRNVPARVEPVAMSPPISAVSIQENMRGELHESHIASDSQHDAESNTVSASQHGEVDCSALSDIQGDAESTTASENQHEAETSSINMATDIPRDVDSNNTCDSQHDPETSRPSMSLDIPQVAAELSITSGSQDESESIGIASDTQHKGVTSLTDTQETRPMLQNTLGKTWSINFLAPERCGSNFEITIHVHITNYIYEGHLWNSSPMNTTEHFSWDVDIESGKGLVLLGSKPLPEQMLTQIFHYKASLPVGHNELKKKQTDTQLTYRYISKSVSSCCTY